MTLNEFKRKYENKNFFEFSEKCFEILGVRPPHPAVFDDKEEFIAALRKFEWKAMIRLEDGGR